MTTSSLDAIKAREESLLCRTYGRYPISIASGKGSRLTDLDGKEYVDLLAGIAVTSSATATRNSRRSSKSRPASSSM